MQMKYPYPGLLLSAGNQWNSLAEKEVLAGWILVGDLSVKDNKWFLGYTQTIIWYLNYIEQRMFLGWNPLPISTEVPF